MNHATAPLDDLARLLELPQPRPGATITQAEIAAALEKGRKFANEVLEQSRREARMAWDGLDRLVLR